MAGAGPSQQGSSRASGGEQGHPQPMVTMQVTLMTSQDKENEDITIKVTVL